MKKRITTTILLSRSAIAFGAVLACCLGYDPPSALATTGSWTEVANLPVSMSLAGGCEVDGIFYVAGGSGGTFQSPVQLNTMFAYDPKTGQWAQKRNMPTGSRCVATCAVNGLIYVIGGGGLFSDPVVNRLEAYDPKTDTWTAKAPLSSPRSLVTACALDGIIYAIGGADSSWNPVTTVEAYDPATDQWTPKKNLPSANSRGVAHAVDGVIYAFFNRSTFAYDPKTNGWTRMAPIPASALNCAGSASGVVDGIIYLFGGLASDDSASYSFTLAYDPAQNSFSAKRLMPLTCQGNHCDSRRAYAACATINGKIYMAGGLNASPYVEPNNFLTYNSALVFDPHGDALAAPGCWTQMTNLPVSMNLAGGCEVDGIFYVAGGSGGTLQSPVTLNTMFAYDPKTGQWAQKRNMPTGSRCVATCAVNGLIYVIGGGGLFSDPVVNRLEAYDPKTDTWTAKAPLSSPRSLVTACALDGIIYAIGGADSSWNPVTTVEAYDPATDQWTPKASLPAPQWRGVAHAVDGVIYAFFDKSTFAYDPKTNGWTRMAPIPASALNCAGSASGVVDGIIYLFGGLASDDSVSYSFTLAYDPAQNSFSAKRLMPVTCQGTHCDSRRAYAACATIDGKIYMAGGLNANPNVEPNNFLTYNSALVFDPHGGVSPQFQSLTLESATSVRLVWQGEAGRLYGVETAPDPAKGPWARRTFSTGATTILATNASVEAACSISTTDPKRFFRVLEAN